MSLESGYTARLVVHRPEGDLSIDFEKWEGGQADSEETKHRNVITRKQTARGGLGTRDNVTLSRECDAEAWAVVPKLEDSRGKDQATAIRQQIDARGSSVGDPETVTGKLKAVTRPNYDLQGTDVGLLAIEVSSDE